jgi:ATP-dependent helicase/nuclease subunit A
MDGDSSLPASHAAPSPGLTDQQREAVFARDVSVLLSSGAGCGKTHVLTERYLSHLREGAEVGQVVAITFTERAARQMRARIRQATLGHLRSAASQEELQLWARHLRGLETAPINTIHAFCGTLLRQFAVEAGLDPAFDILEDVLSVNLESEALSAALQKLLTAQGGAGPDLRDLILLFGWRAATEAVQHLLHAWDAPAWERWLTTPSEEIAADWQQEARGSLLPQYLRYVLAARPKVSRLLPLLRRYPPLPGPLAESVALLLEELPGLPAAEDPAAAVERLAEAAKVGRQGAKAWPDADVYEQIKKAFSDFRDEIRGLKLERFAADPETLSAAIDVGKRFLRVTLEAEQVYQERKRSHGVVDFQDLLVLARDLLRDNEEVRARLQDRYRFLLIDELQDTDPVQMELVHALCGGGLTAGKLFAVGDASQSIYRFRRADVHLFRRLRSEMPHSGRLDLTLNFRSQPAILDFTNALVGHRLTSYEPLRAHHSQVNPGPCVECLWSPCLDEADAAEARSCEAEGIARRIAAMIAGEQLVVERTPDGEHLRPVKRGDVVLLFRAMSNVHLYESALRRHGLDYYLVGGRAFFAQQEIYDLLNLLRALENPQDEVSLAGTLRSPFCCLSDETLFVLRRGHRFRRDETQTPAPAQATKAGLWSGLHDNALLSHLPSGQKEPVLRARRFLDRWRSLKDRLPIARLLGEVFADCGYDAATQFETLGDRKLANLWKMMDLARTFDRTGLFGLADFIARLGDLVENQPREEQAATMPENADVVRLMTIHQAKGLEFPVVFIPDLDADRGGSYPPVAHWDTRLGCVSRPPSDEPTPPFPDYGWGLWKLREDIEDWHESLRILYVACTRAQDYLVLSSAVPSKFRPSGTWMLTLAERFDLFSGECLVPDIPPENVPPVRVTHGLVPAVEPPPVAQSSRLAQVGAAPGMLSPVRTGQTVFTVAELEACLLAWEHGRQELPLLRQGTGGLPRELPAPPLPPEAFAWQFDAEDGSDRNVWAVRRDRTDPARPGLPDRERLLRLMLQQWDFSDPQGWRPLLRQAAGRFDLGPDGGGLEAALAGFVESETFARMASATVRHRELEFLLPWPGKKLPTGLAQRPVIRGVIDCLWKDARGGWHLLWLATGSAGVVGGKSSGKAGPRPGLVFWAHAVKGLFGAWPKDAAVYDLEDGSTLDLAGPVLRQARVLDLFRQALEEIARG